MTPQQALDAIGKLETTDQEFRLQASAILADVEQSSEVWLTNKERQFIAGVLLNTWSADRTTCINLAKRLGADA